MANKPTGRPSKYKEKNRPQAVLTNYKEMSKVNARINARMADLTARRWKCSKCGCNNFMAMEYGCDKCQPFTKDALLLGRVYEG